jgi:hypothetical protein
LKILVTAPKPKEGLERQVYPLLHVLQDLRVNLLQFRPVLLPAGQQLMGRIQAERLLFIMPGLPALLKCLVIDLAAKFQDSVQPGALTLRANQ